MLTNQYIYQYTGVGDPMRLGAQGVSGIGFLGAGTIVVTKHNQIKGLTTAAGLWASAGVGLALGIGFYEAALTATIGIYTILTILQRWEHRVLEIYVELLNSVPLSELVQKLRDLDLNLEGIQFEPDGSPENSARGIVVSLKSKKKQDHFVLKDNIRKIEGVVYMEML